MRDFETSELLYDSLEQMLAELQAQHIHSCALIPFQRLFPHFSPIFKHYIFETENYPAAVFTSEEHSYALLKVAREKTAELSFSYDPREFSGFPSTQQFDGYYAFTLIRLDRQQLKTAEQFMQQQNWTAVHEKITQELLNHRFNFKQDVSLTLSNNLMINEDSHDYPFLSDPAPECNLAFSLMNKLSQLQHDVSMEIAYFLQDRSARSHFIHEQYSDIEAYQQQLEEAFYELAAHTGNAYQTAYLNKDFSYIPAEKFIAQVPNDAETTPADEDDQSIPSSVLYLILFIALVFGLLYLVFWLVSHYAFAKFAVMAILVITVLVIWSKK